MIEDPSPASDSRCPAAPATRDILTSIGEVLYEWALGSDAVRWGTNALEVLKVPSLEAISTGRGYAGFLAPDSPANRYDGIAGTGGVDSGEGVPYELVYSLAPEGSAGPQLWIEDVGRWYGDGRGRPERAHGAIRVINERHARHQQLERLARFDELTGQLNRGQLLEVLSEAIEESTRLRSSCGFLLIGIDHLSVLNDAYGFGVADEVIAVIARRLRNRLRGGDAIGRFSGSKLGIVLRNCADADMAVAAERFIATIREEVVQTALGPYAAIITVGGVLAPRHARNALEAQVRAREALDSARAQRRGNYMPYVPSPQRQEQRRDIAAMADEIVSALNERRVRTDLQPVVAAATGKAAFHECLLRLVSRDGTPHSTPIVIAVAQKVGLVRLLDVRVLEIALKELIDCPEAVLSVNVSPSTIGDPTWFMQLAAAASRHRGLASRLIVEITESAAIEDLAETTRFIANVRAVGARVAIDDFGAGYTSFRNLRHLAVDLIKIDGSFIQGLATSEKDRIFVRTLIELARSLGASTVAEWVSDATSATLLRSWGAEYLQGNFISPASPERPWQATRGSEAPPVAVRAAAAG